MDNVKNVVVVGAGFGGLRAARSIAKELLRLRLLDRYRVFLIDKSDHHTFTPLLYEVATTSKETADIHDLHSVVAYSLIPLLAKKHIVFVQKEVASINIMAGMILFKNGGRMKADHLILAPGSESNFFNIPGLREHALPFKRFEDAIRVRERLWRFIAQGQEQVRILVGGGGSTGVELAGELRMWCGEIHEKAPQCRIVISLIESGQNILGGFPSRVVRFAQQRLAQLNIEVLTGDPIKKAGPHLVELSSGKKMPFDIFVWTGGVKASSLLDDVPLKKEPRGRIEVAEGMKCLIFGAGVKPNIYAIGDSVCFYNPVTKKPIPGVARAAIAQADVAAHNLVEDIKKDAHLIERASHKVFRPWNYPYIIPVGGKYAIAHIRGVTVSGTLAWILKGLVELNYLFSIMRPSRALRIWLNGLFIFLKNDRLG